MRPSFLLALAVPVAALSIFARPAFALTNIGTLTCTTVAAEQDKVDAALSCQFHALSGRDAQFSGRIVRKGPAALPAGKRVLVWTVLAREADVQPRDLAGRFEGTTGGDAGAANKLSGGRDGVIVLEPVTSTSQVGEVPVPSLLELRLEPTRA